MFFFQNCNIFPKMFYDTLFLKDATTKGLNNKIKWENDDKIKIKRIL